MFPPLAFPCHGKGKDALGDGEYDVQDLARDCIRSQRRALPWEREGEGRRKAEEAFLLMEIAFRFTASNVAVLMMAKRLQSLAMVSELPETA